MARFYCHPGIFCAFQKVFYLLCFAVGLLLVSTASKAQTVYIEKTIPSGQPCVGVTVVFNLRSTSYSCSPQVYNTTSGWYVSGTNYTIVSRSNTSISVRWNSAQSNVYVGANYGNCGTGTVYSPQYTVSAATPAAAVSLSHITPQICTDGSMRFTATASNGGTSPYFSWTVNGAVRASGYHVNTLDISGYAAGSYTVAVSLTSSEPCATPTTASASTTLTVNPLPATPAITTSTGGTTLCGSGTLSAPTGYSAYLWSNGAINQSIAVSTASTVFNGSYWVKVRDAKGCWSLASPTMNITINPLPIDGTIKVNNSTNSSITICLGESVTISSAGGLGTPYYWCSTNGGNSWDVFAGAYGGQSSFVHRPTTVGTYRYHLRNQTGCGFCWDVGTCSNAYPSVDVTVVDLPAAPQAYGNVTMPLLPNSSITASSCWDSQDCLGGGHESWKARLFDNSWAANWSAGANNSSQFLQIDLGQIKSVDKILTQGRHTAWDQWVTSYTLSYSMDNVTWNNYPQTFQANTDKETVVENIITNPFAARYVRINPIGWNGHISMRAEIISIPNKGSIVTFLASQPASANTNRWYTTPSGGTAFHTGTTYSTPLTANTTYYVSSYNSATGCESTTRTAVQGTVKTATEEQNLNFIISNTIQTQGIKNVQDIDYLSTNQRQQEITYFDGLGRPVQTVTTQGSPTMQDIVQPIEYEDILGREKKKYLPFTSGNDGRYKPSAISSQASFYSAANTDARATTTLAYSETRFEASPLNRVLEQGAPDAWAIIDENNPLNNKTVKVSSRANTDTDPDRVRKFTYSFGVAGVFGTVSSASYYPAGALLVSETLDEHNNKTVEYKDKEGKVVAKKVQMASPFSDANCAITYYIYDDFGYLRMVIQPEGSAAIGSTGTFTPDATFIKRWCFIYNYDSKGRMSEKTVPGAGTVYMVYNKRDELILTQDAIQRPSRQWNFTKYDAFGRVVLTGLYVHTASATPVPQATMQGLADAITGQYESRTNTNYTTWHGYTNNGSFPTLNLTTDKIYTVNYYDHYNFDASADNSADVNYQASGLSPEPVAFQSLLGKQTGAKVLRMDNNQMLLTATFYDKYGRVIQTQADNHVGGREIATNALDFSGKILNSKLTHSVNLSGASPVTVYKRFEYDHAARLKKVFQRNNDETTEEKISDLSYNELGQIKQKKVGKPATDASFLQTMDFRYNIRGWMTHVNDAALTDAADLFGMELLYNTGTNLSNGAITNGQFNGNIAAQKWKTKTDNTPVARMYSYTYDEANRIKGATYSSSGSVLAENFTLSGMQYDKNGNIKNLTQNGLASYTTLSTQLQSNFGIIDQLTYTLADGNRLSKVEDAATNVQGLAGDFKNGVNQVTEYTYDDVSGGYGNGNLTADLNKGITTITYNHLNLPLRINFNSAGTNYIKYIYTATGAKLRKEVYENGSLASWTDYASGFVYERDKLQFFPTDAGRAISPYFAQNTGSNFTYEYHYKDHLGNLRLSFRQQRPTLTYTATMEPVNAPSEEVQFANLTATRASGNAQAGSYAALVNYQKVLGPFKTLKVNKDDVINAEVWAYHTTTTAGNPVALTTYISNGTNVTGGEESGKNLPLLNVGISYNPAPTPATGTPKAYLKYIFYDKNYTYVSSQTVNVGTAGAWHQLTLPTLTASTDGYVQIFVANESDKNALFDNLKITYTEPMAVQENHYSPFGLNLVGIEKQGAPDDKFQFQEQEKQVELGLNWIQFKWRMHDPQLGRFISVDPLAEKYPYWTPYAFSGNRVVDARELEGLEPYIVTGRAFIPAKTVPSPMAPISNTKSFKGDNRQTYQPNATSFRTEQKVRIDFENKKVTTLSNVASPSVGYDDKGNVTETSKAGKAGPTPTYDKTSLDKGNSTTINMQVDASNKLVSAAPSINYDVNITITQLEDGSIDYQISGSSDGFPGYEFFVTDEATGNSTLIHGSNPTQTGDTPTSLFPPMEKNINNSGNINNEKRTP